MGTRAARKISVQLIQRAISIYDVWKITAAAKKHLLDLIKSATKGFVRSKSSLGKALDALDAYMASENESDLRRLDDEMQKIPPAKQQKYADAIYFLKRIITSESQELNSKKLVKKQDVKASPKPLTFDRLVIGIGNAPMRCYTTSLMLN